MGTGASGVDITYQHNLLRDCTDFYIFGIFNKKYEMNWFLYDVQTNILFEDEDIIVEDAVSNFYTAIDKDIESFVTEVTYTSAKPAAGFVSSIGKPCPPEGNYQKEENEKSILEIISL